MDPVTKKDLTLLSCTTHYRKMFQATKSSSLWKIFSNLNIWIFLDPLIISEAEQLTRTLKIFIFYSLVRWTNKKIITFLKSIKLFSRVQGAILNLICHFVNKTFVSYDVIKLQIISQLLQAFRSVKSADKSEPMLSTSHLNFKPPTAHNYTATRTAKWLSCWLCLCAWSGI